MHLVPHTSLALLAALLLGGGREIACKPLDGMQSDIQKKKDIKRAPVLLDLTCLKLVRGKYVDPQLGAPAKDFRLATLGTGDSCFGTITLDRLSSSAFDTRVTVAYDSPKGMDTVFGSTANLRATWPGSDRLRQIQAQLVLGDGEADDRFDVFVFDEDHLGGNLADVVSYTGATSVDLRMRQTADSFTFYARATPSGLEGLPGAWDMVYQGVDVLPDDPWQLALLVDGLHKGGRFFFDGFALEGPALGGTVEQPLIDDVQAVVEQLEALQPQLDTALEGGGDLDALLASLLAAELDACDVLDALVIADDDDLLQSSTQTKLVLKQLAGTKKKLKLSIARVEQAIAKDDPGKLKPVVGLLAKSIDCLCLGIANLGGYKSTKVAQIPMVPLEP